MNIQLRNKSRVTGLRWIGLSDWRFAGAKHDVKHYAASLRLLGSRPEVAIYVVNRVALARSWWRPNRP